MEEIAAYHPLSLTPDESSGASGTERHRLPLTPESSTDDGERDVPELLRQAVRERAKGRCEYGLTSAVLSGIRCQIDHITLLA